MSKLKPFAFKSTNSGLLATRKDQDDVFSDMGNMDKTIPSGKYVLPGGKPPRINLHEMYKFCQENGIEPKDLTKEQKKQFLF